MLRLNIDAQGMEQMIWRPICLIIVIIDAPGEHRSPRSGTNDLEAHLFNNSNRKMLWVNIDHQGMEQMIWRPIF